MIETCSGLNRLVRLLRVPCRLYCHFKRTHLPSHLAFSLASFRESRTLPRWKVEVRGILTMYSILGFALASCSPANTGCLSYLTPRNPSCLVRIQRTQRLPASASLQTGVHAGDLFQKQRNLHPVEAQKHFVGSIKINIFILLRKGCNLLQSESEQAWIRWRIALASYRLNSARDFETPSRIHRKRRWDTGTLIGHRNQEAA